MLHLGVTRRWEFAAFTPAVKPYHREIIFPDGVMTRVGISAPHCERLLSVSGRYKWMTCHSSLCGIVRWTTYFAHHLELVYNYLCVCARL